jgi:hypothetical protein
MKGWSLEERSSAAGALGRQLRATTSCYSGRRSQAAAVAARRDRHKRLGTCPATRNLEAEAAIWPLGVVVGELHGKEGTWRQR